MGTGNDKFNMLVEGDVNGNWYGPATETTCDPVEFSEDEDGCALRLTPDEQEPTESQDLEDILDGVDSEPGDDSEGAAWFNGAHGNDTRSRSRSMAAWAGARPPRRSIWERGNDRSPGRSRRAVRCRV